MIKAVRHLLLPQVAQVIETTEETETKEATMIKEVLETLMTTRGDQGPRRARIPRRASTPPVGRRRRTKKANWKDGDSGTS